ncbi:MAG: hypothetical protein BWY59_02033 [Verrucomicrobia bacterium ADurb.Bin345]|nr:MAG: hypothetical protein BWY59_02033 [Verrucomicrobia bacterium ADurb.Bin345]
MSFVGSGSSQLVFGWMEKGSPVISGVQEMLKFSTGMESRPSSAVTEMLVVLTSRSADIAPRHSPHNSSAAINPFMATSKYP